LGVSIRGHAYKIRADPRRVANATHPITHEVAVVHDGSNRIAVSTGESEGRATTAERDLLRAS